MSLQSKLFRGDTKLEAAATSNAGHIVPGAVGEHVSKIQQALTQLDAAIIAQNELATRSYGPSTANAVLSYKKNRDIINRSYQTQADDIVGIMTMASLDREMSKNEGSAATVPVLARSLSGACTLPTDRKLKTSPTLPNPLIVPRIISLIPQVRIAIRAADFHLTVAGPHVTTQKQKLPPGLFNEQARASLLLLDKVFDFFKFDNPRPAFDNLRRVYRNMIVALNRSFETSPLVAPTLFVANRFKGMEKVAAAYTSAGGAFRGPKELLELGVPANRIYLCSNLLDSITSFQIIAAIHELAHYVSGAAIQIDDHVQGHFFSPVDVANLNAPNPTLNPRLKTLSPSVKIRDAEHYSAFAFLAGRSKLNNELPEFRK